MVRLSSAIIFIAIILPLMSEAFIHHPGMYGGSHYSQNSSTSTKETKTQAEKLKDPWLWVTVAAFSVCMFFCLRISIKGQWRRCYGSLENENQVDDEGYGMMGGNGGAGGGGGGFHQSGNIHGFR